MCYYNGQKVTREEFIRLMNLEKAVKDYDFLSQELHNGFAYGPIAVIKPNQAKDNFDIVQMEWGFLPTYLKDRDAVEKFRNGYKNAQGIFIKPYTTLNAKSENLFVSEKGKPSIFADAARCRRCLVLSTGFFEWQDIYRKNKRTGQTLKTPEKYPYYITVKDLEYFFFAGIYQEWTDKSTGEVIDTVAIVTAPANELMTQVHNSKKRMPSILDPDLAWEWMMGDLSDERIFEIGQTKYPARKMEACTVAKDFRQSLNPAHPFKYEDVPALELSF